MRSMFGRAIAHDAVVVGADVEPADVVAPDDQDVGLLLIGHDFLLVRVLTGPWRCDDTGRPIAAAAMRFRQVFESSYWTMKRN